MHTKKATKYYVCFLVILKMSCINDVSFEKCTCIWNHLHSNRYQQWLVTGTASGYDLGERWILVTEAISKIYTKQSKLIFQSVIIFMITPFLLGTKLSQLFILFFNNHYKTTFTDIHDPSISTKDAIKLSIREKCTWVRSRNCGCLVTWFCYQLIAKPGNKTATVSWPDPHAYKCLHIAIYMNIQYHS